MLERSFPQKRDMGYFKVPSTVFGLLVLGFILSSTLAFANDLATRGYSIIPAPQEISLKERDIVVDESWGVRSAMADGMAFKRLTSGALEFYDLAFKGNGKGKIVLKLVASPLLKKISAKQEEQAYRLEIRPDLIVVSSSSEQGLFYGVQSLLQLLRPRENGDLVVPEGLISDWPDLELRVIHWDTKHHQDRMETLKRYLDWAAYFKVNAVAFEIEDKYEYPSHPVIGAPGAFTKSEMQEITSYALARYIQLIPVVQAPSHMAFVLKHKEFEHLKADPRSNYHACMCDEEAMDLIFDMYQDMIDATPGVDYFFVSTDEVYYAGSCGKCKFEYNETNRSQAWVDYVNRVHKWMAKRNRKMLAWVEYPLLSEHIEQLPSGIIDAIMGPYRDEVWIANENSAGIEQLAYSSMQGAELLFPNYFPTEYRNKPIDGRLKDAFRTIPDVREKGAQLIGTFAAAWDDAGLHNETFWLGWATVTQYGWTNEAPSLEQSTNDFFNVFYGYNRPEMAEVYKLLEKGARFYEALWDRTPSMERDSAFGSSYGIKPYRLMDLTLEMPKLPRVDNLLVEPRFGTKYQDKIAQARELISQNDRLISLLFYSLSRVGRNRYNIEVLLSIARLERYAMNMVSKMAKAEDYLLGAAKATEKQKALNQLVEAYKLVDEVMEEETKVRGELTRVWEKSQFEKGRSVDGKHFVHVMDDVKDHFADRRVDLGYMFAPFERMEMKQWKGQLRELIDKYSKKNNLVIDGIPVERLED
ncbi:Glycosyl hydrolase family 20, catalytic domain [Pseudozobellia thermophila]|uniref:beta-N-acetylhexosaminidase n=2 Tax=Pseudozobellia thermophila TaxID=192903 RepID=A0A1M6NLV8_9FLAO|nr:Glycosyl hydrolase family 20, catalytic domain [Pseudozobellia thermophila]